MRNIEQRLVQLRALFESGAGDLSTVIGDKYKRILDGYTEDLLALSRSRRPSLFGHGNSFYGDNDAISKNVYVPLIKYGDRAFRSARELFDTIAKAVGVDARARGLDATGVRNVTNKMDQGIHNLLQYIANGFYEGEDGAEIEEYAAGPARLVLKLVGGDVYKALEQWIDRIANVPEPDEFMKAIGWGKRNR